MKIVFVFSKAHYYFYYDRVVRLLCAWGHDVKIVYRAGLSDDGNKSSRALIKLIEEEPRITVENAIFRQKSLRLVGTLRELANYATYMRPEHPTPHLAQKGAKKHLPPLIFKMIQKPVVKLFLSSKFAKNVLQFSEFLTSPDKSIVNWLVENRPHVIIASPYIFSTDLEVEYVKAAHQLRIPTIASVLSWDNLTSKGTYQVKPDWLFVWNQNLVNEAVQIHDFVNEHVFVTGAPVYDFWFDLTPSMDREAFCALAGVYPAKPYILYLCSSNNISENEVELISKLVVALELVKKEERPFLVIRPHPFKEINPDMVENEWVKVFPIGGQRPDTNQARQTYYDSLYYSAIVIGVNTTGFLEAAVLDKPCLTLVDSSTSRGQAERAHFKHLTDADFIEIANDYTEMVAIIKKIIAGNDSKLENRRKFVHNFIRPKGIDVQSSLIMAQASLAVANGQEPDCWKENHLEKNN